MSATFFPSSRHFPFTCISNTSSNHYKNSNPNIPSFISNHYKNSNPTLPFSISSCLNQNPSHNVNPNLLSKPHNAPLSVTADHDFSISPSEPRLNCNTPVTMRTAPWMKGPVLPSSDEILDLSRPKSTKTSKKSQKVDRALTAKESGVRGKKAMRKIVERVGRLPEKSSIDETETSSGEYEFGSSLEMIVGADENENTEFGKRMPWMKDERFVFRRVKKEKVASAAELTLERELLKKLRKEAAQMKRWVKVMKAGVTQKVVDEIKWIWKRNELAMVKFDVPLCRNMDRAREILELKTGGLVVWSKKDKHVIYRGTNYQSTLKYILPMKSRIFVTSSSKPRDVEFQNLTSLSEEKSFGSTNANSSNNFSQEDSLPVGILGSETIDGSLFEREADRLLDGLGPRYIDWWMRKPLPVDADLLPEVVPGYKSPSRRCPPRSRSKLNDDELTYLRKLAQCLPTHFVLGRNRKLQGLAAAILKLWESSLIAKIAVKWGIPNTDDKQMAYELKQLTGGVLILRNKFYIILYRGKDFLPSGVANLVEEREVELRRDQYHEEAARLGAIATIGFVSEQLTSSGGSGTLSEFQYLQNEFRDPKMEELEADIQLGAEKERLESEIRKLERKLFILNAKIKKSEEELLKLDSTLRPAEQDGDQEMMTEEERTCFRKMGLKMDSSLALGRRGVFSGVLEGLHQHWKHREVVKVITMQEAYSQLIFTAKMLEAESGGILVSVDKLKEGYAIIIYRGRNYRRPLIPVTGHLLNKREALRRSLEMQRIGSLQFFANQRKQAITDLRFKLAHLQQSQQQADQGDRGKLSHRDATEFSPGGSS